MAEQGFPGLLIFLGSVRLALANGAAQEMFRNDRSAVGFAIWPRCSRLTRVIWGGPSWGSLFDLFYYLVISASCWIRAQRAAAVARVRAKAAAGEARPTAPSGWAPESVSSSSPPPQGRGRGGSFSAWQGDSPARGWGRDLLYARVRGGRRGRQGFSTARPRRGRRPRPRALFELMGSRTRPPFRLDRVRARGQRHLRRYAFQCGRDRGRCGRAPSCWR